MARGHKIKADDIYHNKIIEASSPLTKRPATPFRVASLLMMEKEYCYEREWLKPSTGGGTSPTPYPVHPRPDNCRTIAYGVFVNLGERFEVKVKYGKGKPVSKKYQWDTTMLEGTGDGFFTGLNHGTTVVYEIATMEDGSTCVTEVPVSMVEEATIPTPPECKVVLRSFEVEVNKTIEIPITHEEGRNIRSIVVIYDKEILHYDEATKTFTGLAEGVSEIKVFIEYVDGRRCDLTSYGEVLRACTSTYTINGGTLEGGAYTVQIGDVVTITFTDSERPIIGLQSTDLQPYITGSSTSTITFIPTSEMVSKDYIVTVDHGSWTCDYNIKFNVKLYRESKCSVDLNTNGSAFAIFEYADQPSGRYYVTYDMYGYPDMLSVFFGDPFDPATKSQHVYMAADKDKSPIYFDYTEGQGSIYLQINCEGVTNGTAFELYMYCPGTAPESVTSTANAPMPGENVNFDEDLRNQVLGHA